MSAKTETNVRSLPSPGQSSAVSPLSGLPTLVLDTALCIIISAVGLFVRLPNYMVVPAITDESREVALAIEILRNGAHPLIGVDAYNGPLYQYLLALAFKLFGLSVEMPRLFILFIGVLTVAVTYVLARIWAGPLAGLIAALLMAFSGVHIAINSHIAWSNSMTPFFTTLAAVPFALAGRELRTPNTASLVRVRWYLPLGGFLFGLALQTHPSAIAFGLGLVLWFVSNRNTRALLRTPYPYLAILFALVAYSNVILYNVQMMNDPNNSLAAAMRREYAYSPAATLPEYSSRVLARGIELTRMLAPSFGASQNPMRYLANPYFSMTLLVVLLGLAYTARRSSSLPLGTLAISFALFPFLVRRDNFPIESRYLSFLLPLCYVSVGILVGDALKRLVTGKRGVVLRWGFAGMLLTIPVAWDLHAWSDLNAYYNFLLTNGPNNSTLLRVVEELRGLPEPVWIDSELGSGYWLGAGAEVGEAFDYLFTLAGTTHQTFKGKDALHELAPRALVILTAAHYSQWREEYDFELVDAGPPTKEVNRVLGAYAVYRVNKK